MNRPSFHSNAAGIAHARGFALNVSNFQSTARNVSYANAVNAALGSANTSSSTPAATATP